MDKKTFEPKRYGMAICPCCNSHGYIQNQNVNVVLNAGALGSSREPEEDTHTSPIIGKGKETSHYEKGDIYESLLDGTEYVVKRIVNKMVLLQEERKPANLNRGWDTRNKIILSGKGEEG
jgi:hypothetical protein